MLYPPTPIVAQSHSSQDLERYLDEILACRIRGGSLLGELRRRVEDGKIYFGGRPLPTFPKPHIIAAEDEQRWVVAAERLMQVFESASRRLLGDEALLRGLGLPDGSEDLFEIDPGYSRFIVVSRFDMIWSGGDVRVLELNADSPAMMTFTDRVEEILLDLDPIGGVLAAQGARPFSRTRALHQSIMATYREWGGTRRDPTIAIVDWHGEATASELTHTAADFERFGSPTVVCDPSELHIVEGRLHARGHRIDVVQRRVLFPDFIRRASELETLLTAYRSGRVCMLNPLRSYVMGNKVALAMVSQNALGLSPADQRLVSSLLPPTEIVSPHSIERLRREKDEWVLKGAFSSGGKEVTIGIHTSPVDWLDHLARATRQPSVVQRLAPIPRYRVPIQSASGEVELCELYANWNPWFFGGRFGGATTRVGWKPIVVISGGGGLLASMTTGAPMIDPTLVAEPRAEAARDPRL
ncbi:MAG TPA: glutathionylspermidine synthase family protein [Kofleriaceae bacterium]|nr:glutathionylspermidine synthase family protein [Kofleriaceae bacterium]